MTETEKKSDGADRRYWVALNQIDGMDPHIFFKLVEKFGSPKAVWHATERELAGSGVALAGFVLKSLLEQRERGEDGRAEIARAKDAGCRVRVLTDRDYPARLREIPMPPPVLYLRGEWNKDDERAAAMVGTRECNGYGRKMAEEIAGGLARAGYTVVSGLAHGIDAAAHRAALEAGGRTVAVKAVGLDVDYPSAHRELAERIAASGALVSEFPLGQKAIDKWQFHRRNRIISGLSRGTIVVQSRRKGGSIITAMHAIDQGREVFAVPGDARNAASGGCHWLIRRHGAHLVESAEDVLEVFGESLGQTQLDFGGEQLEGVQADIFEILKAGPAGFDEICSRLGKPPSEISTALMMLEMKGRARELPGKLYTIT